MAATGRDTFKVTTPSDQEFVISREFDAPRDLLFEAHSSCEHLRNWWGPRKYEVADCDVDFRPGGAWRIVHRAEGEEHVFQGEFQEIVRPERITWTFEWMGMPGHVSVQTVTFEEHDGKTTLTSTARFDTKEDRDGMLQGGATEGAAETWDRLEEHVRTLGDAAS
jgi:uncharacterized protein YndB with AHSA1/START domain